MPVPPPTDSYTAPSADPAARRPGRTSVVVIIALALSVFVAHLITAFGRLVVPVALPLHFLLLLESVVLLVILLPVLYLLVYKPALQWNRELRQLERDLRRSEAQYRRIVETAQEGIWTTDAEGRTLFVNARMARMLGYTPDEMRGRPFYTFMDDASQQDARQALAAGLSAMTGVSCGKTVRHAGPSPPSPCCQPATKRPSG